MRRVALLGLILLPLLTSAQTPSNAPAPAPSPTATTADGVEHVHLGQSVTPLVGPWKFHTGDNPAWAQPGFDDSAWTSLDMTAEADPSDPSQLALLPGWTARGFPGYSGFAWYRLQVDVDSKDRSLSLKMPDQVDDAYQVFVNGVKIGELGKFNGRKVTGYETLPRYFPLPRNGTGGTVTIAVRLWMDPATRFLGPDVGGLRDPPMLGYTPDVAGLVHLGFDDVAHAVGSGFLESLILLMAFLMAAALYWLEPEESAYLWLALVCLVTLLGNSILLLASFRTTIGQTGVVILSKVIATPVRIGLWVLFWAYWFRLPRIHRIQWVTWPLVALLATGTAMTSAPLFGQVIPVKAAGILIPVLLVVKLGLGLLLWVVAIQGFTRRKAEGGMAGAAVLLAFVANFQHELRLIHLTVTTTLFGFAVSMGTLSTILSLLIISVMLLRRFMYSQRLQEQWKLEIEQARSVQQVLIPDKLPVVKGLQVESEYHPAREVGGDFFQIVPLAEPGSAIIVVGDVTGKGLQAGMLVALIVGAIRTAIQQTTDPAQILAIVNNQLAEREHSSATCIVLRISQSGTLTLSHAGHLPPYLNGKELPIEGALPLGMMRGVEFSDQSLQLHAGDELILASDGVAEAQDSRGNLFGFDRVNEMVSRRASAEEIATAAQEFGQADDITVLQLRWQGHAAAVDYAREPQLTAH
ncbi:MAG TPA: SpoIIE family protein phosphatase [Acidobacteriaceae bacterium]|jgi:hypothetical protein